MKTQGISSLVTPDMSGKVSSKKTKTPDSSFDSFIANRNMKKDMGGQDAVRPVGVKGRPTSDKFKSISKDSKVSTKNDKTQSGPVMSDSSGNVAEENVQVVVMTVFQVNFQMSEEDVRDLMNQAGISVEDFAQMIQDGILNSEGLDMIQNLVMKFHGITDKAALLTDDSLTDEMDSIAEQISGMMAETDGSEWQEDGLATNLDVVFEKISESDSTGEDGGLSGQSGAAGQKEERDFHVTESSAGEQFVQDLSQVYEQSDMEESSSVHQTMSRIVEQVVSQVRIRVMASTTSMELQLHPASLGRVNLQVVTASGVSTALLTVESQAAKEALESQLIRLKQTFEEQGLKVNEVEVNVSEFGLGEHNREADQGQQSSQGGNREFRFDDGEQESLDANSEDEMRQTAAEKRDTSSTVDYTA